MKKRNSDAIRFISCAGLPEIDAVCGIDVDAGFSRHVHEGYCIGIIRKGERVINQGGVSTIIPENGMFVINPGVSHACKSRYERHSYCVIGVTLKKIKAAASLISGEDSAAPVFNRVLILDAKLRMQMNRLIRLMEYPGSGADIGPVLDLLLSGLIKKYGEKPLKKDRGGLHREAVRKVCEYISTNYSRDITLRDLSKVACLSPYYLQRLFLEHMGISPHDYLIQLRIRKATALLSAGSGIAGAALEVGFADQSHFTHSFRKATGTTPGAYLACQCR